MRDATILRSNNLYYIDYISQGSGSNILWRTNVGNLQILDGITLYGKVNNSTFKVYVNGKCNSLSSY